MCTKSKYSGVLAFCAHWNVATVARNLTRNLVLSSKRTHLLSNCGGHTVITGLNSLNLAWHYDVLLVPLLHTTLSPLLLSLNFNNDNNNNINHKNHHDPNNFTLQ